MVGFGEGRRIGDFETRGLKGFLLGCWKARLDGLGLALVKKEEFDGRCDRCVKEGGSFRVILE